MIDIISQAYLLTQNDAPLQELDFRELLLSRLRDFYNKQRDEIHVSGICLCPRQTGFQIRDGKRHFTDRTLKYFLNGELKHNKIQSILGDDFEIEKEVRWNGLVGHIDAFYKPHGVPIEIKTTESDRAGRSYYEHNAFQLKSYMAITGAPYGILFYIIIGKFDVPELFPQYILRFRDEKEREKQFCDMIDRAGNLQKGVFTKRMEDIWHVAYHDDFIGWRKVIEKNPTDGKLHSIAKRVNWLCGTEKEPNCDYFNECKRMRDTAGGPENDQTALKLIDLIEKKRAPK